MLLNINCINFKILFKVMVPDTESSPKELRGTHPQLAVAMLIGSLCPISACLDLILGSDSQSQLPAYCRSWKKQVVVAQVLGFLLLRQETWLEVLSYRERFWNKTLNSSSVGLAACLYVSMTLKE